jgi:hypothetical protein
MLYCSLGKLICIPPSVSYLSVGLLLVVSRFSSVLFVLKAIFSFVFLNRFVTKVVSLPVYVNEAHLCVDVLGVLVSVGGVRL